MPAHSQDLARRAVDPFGELMIDFVVIAVLFSRVAEKGQIKTRGGVKHYFRIAPFSCFIAARLYD
jgi:hypothetical protein